jgi:outer membrane protein assembly factor BamD (BamD/ComL family)
VGQLAQLKLAVWYYKTAAFAQSLQIAEDLLAKHPDNMFKAELDYLTDLAARARLRELRDELNPVQLLSEYVRLRPYLREPESNSVLDILAWGYERSGLNQKAAQLYKVLGSRQMYKPDYWVDAARNYFLDGQNQNTMDTLHEVNLDELSPAKQNEFLYLEGITLTRQGHYREAALALLALLKKDSELQERAGQVYLNLGPSLAHMPGREQDALNALDLAEQALAREGAKAKSSRLLAALQSGLLSRDNKAQALMYLQRAYGLSDDAKDKAPILYEIFLSQRALGQREEMLRSLNDLAALKVDPWSPMAERLLADKELGPELERMGRELQQRGGALTSAPQSIK